MFFFFLTWRQIYRTIGAGRVLVAGLNPYMPVVGNHTKRFSLIDLQRTFLTAHAYTDSLYRIFPPNKYIFSTKDALFQRCDTSIVV